MKQPDRFARVAQKCVPMVGDAGAYRLQMSIIADALKREHRAMVRLVKHLKNTSSRHVLHSSERGVYTLACNDLLAALAKRAR